MKILFFYGFIVDVWVNSIWCSFFCTKYDPEICDLHRKCTEGLIVHINNIINMFFKELLL